MSQNENGSQEEISQEELQKQLEAQKSELLKDLQQGLSLVSRTYSGSYAFLKLDYREKELNKTFDLIQNFEHVRFLDLSNNKLQSLDDIKHLKYLQKINLSQNEFEEFGIFTNSEIKFNYLEELDLSKNKLKEITFDNCKQLKRLYLQENQLQQLNLNSFETLVKIELRNNKLKQIGNLESQKNLKKFFGANNKFENLFQFKNLLLLEELHLRQNHVGEQPDEISRDHFSSLQILNLRQNSIKNINFFEFIKFCQNLKKLNFIENPSKKISENEEEKNEEEEEQKEQQEAEEIEPITLDQFIKQILQQNNLLENTTLQSINKSEINEDFKQQYSDEKEQLKILQIFFNFTQFKLYYNGRKKEINIQRTC